MLSLETGLKLVFSLIFCRHFFPTFYRLFAVNLTFVFLSEAVIGYLLFFIYQIYFITLI